MLIRNKTLGLAAILAASVSGAALAQGVSLGVSGSGDAGIGVGDSGVSIGADTGVTADAGTTGTTMEGSTGADAGATTTMESADAGASTSMGAQAGVKNLGDVVSSLRAGASANADVTTIDADSQISTVAVSELQGNGADNAQSLDNAMADASVELTDLHAMVAGNADLMAALEAEGFASDDVIGVYETADGQFEVLVDDRS